MAPDDLNLTVDFNDASFEDEGNEDAYIPETWASNRNSTGDNASMAVLGAGSEAAEFVFDFDPVNHGLYVSRSLYLASQLTSLGNWA